MKYYVIAGEASGDLHASNLIKEIKNQQPLASFRCWGGDLMQAQGATLVKHYRDLAFMGFIEVIANLRIILKNIDWCKKDILTHKPDVLILVDYPGFNLRIAEFAKLNNIKVVYYISPQIWAWKQSRVHKIKKTVDKMLVILPFEKDFYKRFDMPVDFVGHPLLDAIEDSVDTNSSINKNIIALLPGSRKQEIKKILPVMLSVCKYFPDYKFVIAAAPSQPLSFYNSFEIPAGVDIWHNKTYDLLQASKAALVTSGTATLEAALFDVPEIVCYKGSSFSYAIARSLVKVKYISLVNLIMDAPIVSELIQADCNTQTIKSNLEQLLDRQTMDRMKHQFKELKQMLGGKGASARAAKLIVDFSTH